MIPSSPPVALDAELAVSPPSSSSSTAHHQPDRPKSPPLAFAPSSNDSLFARNSSPYARTANDPTSPSQSIMGRLSPLSESPLALQAIIDKQAEALRQLHKAFQAERESWDLERQRFWERICSLEQLLKNGEHHSPEKSPVSTPTRSNGSGIVSPHARAAHPPGIHLPTIAEIETVQPLATRRDGAPQSIALPGIMAVPGEERQRQSSVVSFTNAEGLKVEEIPLLLPAAGLSPPPPVNRMLAGHTPIKVPRRPTPPPENSLSMDGIEDTPTRHNTHVNTYLTQSSDEEEDMPLKGPLIMPELPHRPDDTNFTLEALSSRLQEISEHPEEEQSKPLVYAKPSPGLASPAEDANEGADSAIPPCADDPVSPVNTRALDSNAIQSPSSAFGSNLSPSVSNTKSPDPSGALSPQEQHEAKIHEQFEQGGIRLKKKTSTNFGAPFGSLAGLPIRKMS